MGCTVNGAEIVLSGDVGASGFWFDDAGFSASDVIMALAQVGDENDITVRLNSGGGIVWDGSAIHASLARHTGKVTVVVEGCAASSGSVIAMAGDEVIMSLGAVMMVHDPATITIGTAEDHQVQISQLMAVSDSMAAIYAKKTGLSIADCRADMAAETWMTADQAVAKGYADRVIGQDDQSAAPIEPAPHAYASYRHAPEPIMALAKARRWSGSPQASIPKQPKPRMTKETAAMPTEEEIQARIDAAVKKDREENRNVDGGATAKQGSTAVAADIAEICASAGVPTMAATLIREGVTAETAKARVDAAGKIKDVVALARRVSPSLPTAYADEAIAAGKTVATVKVELFDRMAAADEALPITAAHRAGAGSFDHAGNTTRAEAKKMAKANMQQQLKRQPNLSAKTEA